MTEVVAQWFLIKIPFVVAVELLFWVSIVTVLPCTLSVWAETHDHNRDYVCVNFAERGFVFARISLAAAYSESTI